MSPSPGSIHRRPRSDSGAARLWHWARKRRSAWTCAEAAEAAGISERRARAYVRAMAEAQLLVRAGDGGTDAAGQFEPAQWRVASAARRYAAPVMVAAPGGGTITGARVPIAGDVDRIKAAQQRLGVSGRELARRLGISDRTLRRMISGSETPLVDDPIWDRLEALS